MSRSAAAIRQIRSFNRTVTECIGALEERFLGRTLPLGEARILWEIGPEGAEVRALREKLGLDSGYLSRVLRSLEQKRLIRVRGSANDGRVRRAALTRKGLAERSELDRRSDILASRILEPLSDRQQAALVAAAAQVERLMQAALVRFAVEDPATDDARWCFGQYFAELDARFESGFEPARSIPADVHELRPPLGMLLIARLRGRPVGCAALKVHGKAPAELKRMWIAPEARGLGLGRRLLQDVEQRARAAGVTVIRLETNRALGEAIDLYRRSGYVEVDPFNQEAYAHHWFEKRLAKSRRNRGPV